MMAEGESKGEGFYPKGQKKIKTKEKEIILISCGRCKDGISEIIRIES